MNTKNDGGPAFPVSTGMGPLSANSASPGMSIRDWFAGKFMQGYLSQDEYGGWGTVARQQGLASMAYDMADAMIEQSKK